MPNETLRIAGTFSVMILNPDGKTVRRTVPSRRALDGTGTFCVVTD
jgi:hypothetical protein